MPIKKRFFIVFSLTLLNLVHLEFINLSKAWNSCSIAFNWTPVRCLIDWGFILELSLIKNFLSSNSRLFIFPHLHFFLHFLHQFPFEFLRNFVFLKMVLNHSLVYWRVDHNMVLTHLFRTFLMLGLGLVGIKSIEHHLLISKS